ncbi:MAG: hypothetical protein QOF92_2348 [Pseudonocardiales bacterium]|nr:hypothetical protein [Pseudonocardiales bacterium]
MSRPLTIAVSGTGGEVADELIELAREVGALLARDGVLVVTGGLDGIMAAAAQGAREAGGQVVGLLPGDRSDGGNEHLSVALATGLGQMRNALLVNAADGLISVGGSWGTLSEIALATRAGKPVVCLRGWTVTDADGRPLPLVVADTAAEAVAVLRNALG